MQSWRRTIGRALLVVLPLAAGIALVVLVVRNREPPAMEAVAETRTAVRVQVLERRPFVPTIRAFGAIEPVTTWRAVAEVGGRIEELAPDLKAGRLMEEGALLARLDATDYELAEAQAIARVESAQARLAELEAREASLEASLEIEERVLAVTEAELERRRSLFERGTISQASLDQALEAFLQRRARLQDIKNEISLLPAQERVQEAERAVAEAQLAEARRNIERTRIVMPFAGRIADVPVAQSQFVAAGQVLLEAEDIAAVEAVAWLRLEEVRALFADRLPASSLVELSAGMMDQMPLAAEVEAVLRLEVEELVIEWPAELRRFTFALDPRARTLGLVVAVSDPFAKVVPGQRPPLVKDMFVEVVLEGPPIPDALVVPRTALRQGAEGAWQVALADEGDRLRLAPVEIAHLLGDEVVIEAGIVEGERVIVSALPFAVAGMLLDPQPVM